MDDHHGMEAKSFVYGMWIQDAPGSWRMGDPDEIEAFLSKSMGDHGEDDEDDDEKKENGYWSSFRETSNAYAPFDRAVKRLGNGRVMIQYQLLTMSVYF